jgi:hypothetical protein
VQLTLIRIILHILHLTKVGNTTGAAAKLREHHQLMDTAASTEPNTWGKGGVFQLTLHTGATLQFEWFSQSEAFVFGYLLSGVVNLHDSSTTKGRAFLAEGVRVIDSTSVHSGGLIVLAMLVGETDDERWLSDLQDRRARLCRIKRYTLLYLAFANLLRSHWDEAFEVPPPTTTTPAPPARAKLM